VTGQLLRIVDYTPNAEALSEAIAKLNARPATNDGGQLLDAISETAQELQKREAARPVILALTVGGEEHSTLPAHHVLDKLRQSGAVLHVVAVANNALRSQSNPSTAAGLLGENMNLNEVLGDGPKQSGGRREEIVAATGISGGLAQLARSLKNQYLIEYTLPCDPSRTYADPQQVERAFDGTAVTTRPGCFQRARGRSRGTGCARTPARPAES
jgi:hypothetical protein